ncbi:MAG: dihydrodipicolinate synthase family protein [Candidatus Brocadiae bacterium]|nr:dihydrodipicolinate synthase family protein [Candidatus Brocadiia bacterium]
MDPRIPYEYHRSIADETGLPIILFQLAPVFGGVLYTRQTLLELCEIPQVVAIKEASFDAQCFAETKSIIDQVGRPITVLSGNDRFITESFLLGAEGALLGFAAVGCGLVADMLAQLQAESYSEAMDMRGEVQGFADVIYRDPVLDYRARCKVALGHLGVISPELAYVRPPMLQIGESESEDIRMALVSAGMLAPA